MFDLNALTEEIFGAKAPEGQGWLDRIHDLLGSLEVRDLWLCNGEAQVVAEVHLDTASNGGVPSVSAEGGDALQLIREADGAHLFCLTLADESSAGSLVGRLGSSLSTTDLQRELAGRLGWLVSLAEFVLDLTAQHALLVSVQSSLRQLEREYELVQSEHGKMQALNLEALEKLKATQEQMFQQERLRSLGQLAGGVAHDLNNTLLPVLGYADLLLTNPDLPEALRADVALIHTGATDAAAVVSRLKGFAQQQPQAFVSGTVDMEALLGKIPALTQPKWHNEAQRSGRKIELKLELESTPAVRGNQTELREVLTNLVINAVDAMPNGGAITLRLRAEPPLACVEVVDEGTGMTEMELKRCSEPFFSTKGEAGTGLGLSVCYGIIQRHSGRMAISSEPGRGTTVRIFLPLAKGAAEPTTDLITPRLARRHILFVDDDVRARRVMRDMLERLGQTVDVAESGEQGLKLFEKGRYELLITDLGMPGMDGYELCRKIPQSARGVPILMVTGWSPSSVSRGRCKNGRAPDLVVEKPITLGQLREALEQLLG